MRNPSSSAQKVSISSIKPTSTTTPCCSKVGIKRGPWTPEEDELLANYIKKEGQGRWRTLPKRAGLMRCGKSCRLRWMNYLRPCVKRGRIAPDEEDLILRLHKLLGNRWSLIAGRIPGRTDNEIKNYWNTHLSKKLISQGIDPRTHKPLHPDHPSSLEIASDPNQSSNHKASKLEETGKAYRTIATKVSQNFKVTNLDQHQSQVAHGVNGTENWPYCNALFMEWQGGLGASNSGDYYLGNIGNEDTFSSFLDCLINDNVFGTQQEPQPNMVAPSIQPFVSSSETLNIHNASIWENEVSMATLANGQDGTLNNHPAALALLNKQGCMNCR